MTAMRKILLLSEFNGVEGNANSDLFQNDVSTNGGLVVFDSSALNLPGGDGDGNDNVYLWSGGNPVYLAGVPATNGNGSVFEGSVSSTGGYVAYVGPDGISIQSGNATIPLGTFDEVFLYNTATRSTTMISAIGGQAGIGNSAHPSVSADGSEVAFDSTAPANLVDGGIANLPGANGHSQIYLWQNGALALISQNGGAAGNGDSWLPSVSSNGVAIAFESLATNLPGATGGQQVYEWTRTGGLIDLGGGENPSISSDGSSVAFDADLSRRSDSDLRQRFQ